jgi:hypothetical protein
MPTYDKELKFLRDWDIISPEQRRLFMDAVAAMVHDLAAGQGFRAGLRVKGVRGRPGVYGTSPHPGDVHIIWCRIGGHEIV